jgi:hypothetical protein
MKKYKLEVDVTQTDRVRYNIIAENEEDAMKKAREMNFDGSPEVVEPLVCLDIELKNAVLFEVEEKLTPVVKKGGDAQ